MGDKGGFGPVGVRRVLGRSMVVASVLLTACTGAPRSPAPSSPAPAKFLGNVWSPAQLPGFTELWNQVTPENAGKWGSMEPTRGIINWGPLDSAYALAKDNGFPFRFHVLVWGNQQPAWMESLPPHEQRQEIEKRFAAVAARYPAIDYIEVVNEPMNDPPLKRNESDRGSGNYMEALGGRGRTGWDWVINAFRLARQHFPNTKLMLNEYSVTSSDSATTRYLELIELLRAEKLIDVIGVQEHAFETTVPASVTRANLDRLAATGLPIQITEFDIDGSADEVQLESYKRIFPVLWEHPAVIGVTFWGWRPGMWRTRFGANLVREDGTRRPAMDWLLEYLNHPAARR